MAYFFRGRNQQRAQRSQQQGLTQVLPETIWVNDPLPSGVPPEGSVVVTISRQFGSGGAEIGRIVARESALDYVDHEIIDEVARRLGVNAQHVEHHDEQTSGTVGHILEALQSSNPFAINYSTLFGPTPSPTQSRDGAYLHLTQKVVMEVATRGNSVIIGRGGQFLLHNSPRTLHIYVFAPLAYRIENVMHHFQLPHEKAVQLIERRDYEIDGYLHHNYGSDGHQPNLYHLLINTSLFSFELAARLVREALPLAKTIG
ncbi:MAG TPA: cytidylate kinase-like family protein [Ktedonobacteraceae bacterium]|nr:cytidylate kinase-like family protein [Ktedonobacteraceae bacterium]